MLDLSVQPLDDRMVNGAELIAFYLPMHTATRLALPTIAYCHAKNATAHICCFGLYAPMNEDYLRTQGAHTIIGGEFETRIAALYCNLAGVAGDPKPRDLGSVDLRKQRFLVPEGMGFPPWPIMQNSFRAMGLRW